jgi:hypothetical protein
MILPSDTVSPQILTASLNKQQIIHSYGEHRGNNLFRDITKLLPDYTASRDTAVITENGNFVILY